MTPGMDGERGNEESGNEESAGRHDHIDPIVSASPLEWRVERLALTVDQLAALARQDPGPQSSVTIENTSKGVNISVKVYALTPFQAALIAQQIYDQLATEYPGVPSRVIPPEWVEP